MMRDAEILTFVDRLLLLPLLTWRDAAMACPRQLAVTTERALADAIHTPELAIDVWNTRDDVETAICRFDCVEGRELLRMKGQREHVHFVSERAALAVLVHEALAAEDFSACYGGFSRCITLEALHLH
jgi:hypothetical protein